MFDYEKLKNDVSIQLENTLRKWMEENNDIYILSLDCARNMRSIGIVANTWQYLREQVDFDSEDYWYYKYSEEEWALSDVGGKIEDISLYMGKYQEEHDEIFTNPSTFEFTEVFDEHCDKMIEMCKEALYRFKQSINKDFPDLLLGFNVREYLDNEERIKIFTTINSNETAKEYMEHIDDFN